MHNLKCICCIGAVRHWPVNGQAVSVAKCNLRIPILAVHKIHVHKLTPVSSIDSFDGMLTHLLIKGKIIRYGIG